jgi:hypothetical protein
MEMLFFAKQYHAHGISGSFSMMNKFFTHASSFSGLSIFLPLFHHNFNTFFSEITFFIVSGGVVSWFEDRFLIGFGGFD